MANKTKRQCQRSDDHAWVDSHERNGKKVDGYCRETGD
jgi:oligoendopeptidase F